MLRSLLESVGIEAMIEGEGVAPLGLPPDIVGASILVPDGDAVRAREVVGVSGVFAGEAASDAVEIGEDEWRAAADGQPLQEPPRGVEPDPDAPLRTALRWSAAAIPLCFTILVPLMAFVMVGRAARAAPASLRLTLASLLAAVSLCGGVLFWVEVAPSLAPRRPIRTIDLGGGRSIPLPERPAQRRPFP